MSRRVRKRRIKRVAAMRADGYAMQQIADAQRSRVSRQAIEQRLKKYERLHGVIVCRHLRPAEAARMLGMSDETFRRFARTAAIPRAIPRASKAWYTKEAINAVARAAGRDRECIACGRPFRWYGQRHRVTCGSRCAAHLRRSGPLRRRARRSVYERPVEACQLRGWLRTLWETRAAAPPPAKGRYLASGDALRLAGIASIQLSYLHRRGFIRTQPHPTARWHGRPRLLYHRGDLELAGRVWRAEKVRRAAAAGSVRHIV